MDDKEKLAEILRPFDELIEEQEKMGDTYFVYLLRRAKQALEDDDPMGLHYLVDLKGYYDYPYSDDEDVNKKCREERQATLEKIRQALED